MSKMEDQLGEFFVADCQPQWEQAYELLLDHGYKPRAGDPRPDIGGARVRITDGLWSLADDGEFMIVQAVTSGLIWPRNPVLDKVHGAPDISIYDIVCWHPARPDEWYLYRGEPAIFLGDEPSTFSEKFFLSRNPFSWLQGGCRGGVMLDTACLRMMMMARTIVCEDVAHGNEIKKSIREMLLAGIPEFAVRGPARKEVAA